jgi:hypothetical protein
MDVREMKVVGGTAQEHGADGVEPLGSGPENLVISAFRIPPPEKCSP